MSTPRFWLRYVAETPTPGGSDEQPAPGAPEQQPQPAPEAPSEPQTFDAEYVANLRKEAAKYRTQAKANAEAAKRLADIEEANKTDAQKQAEALAALQQENEALKLATLKAQVAALKGVPADLLSGSSQEELEAAADRLLAFKGSTPDPVPDFGAGDRGKSNAVTQVTRTELASMTPQQIEEARIAGRLDDVLAGK